MNRYSAGSANTLASCSASPIRVGRKRTAGLLSGTAVSVT